MHAHFINGWEHDHQFLSEGHARNEHRARLAMIISLVMMVVEIAAGLLFGSMALLADGLHMGTHVGALGIAAAAYLYARRYQHDPRFAFGTGKLGDLAAFTSAVMLGFMAALIGWESLVRIATPQTIGFDQSVAVAVLGLAANLVAVAFLHDGHHGPHGHDGHHGHHGHGHTHDHNLRAAYLHMVADSLTSVLAIGGLLAGKHFGILWLDPVVGVVGAVVIGRWSVQLMRQSGAVLLDAAVDPALARSVRHVLEGGGDRLADLHVWRVGPGHNAAIVSIVSQAPQPPEHYKARLSHLRGLCHVTVEVHEAQRPDLAG